MLRWLGFIQIRSRSSMLWKQWPRIWSHHWNVLPRLPSSQDRKAASLLWKLLVWPSHGIVLPELPSLQNRSAICLLWAFLIRPSFFHVLRRTSSPETNTNYSLLRNIFIRSPDPVMLRWTSWTQDWVKKPSLLCNTSVRQSYNSMLRWRPSYSENTADAEL